MRMKLATMLVMVGLSLRVCGESPRTPNVQEAPRTEQVPAGTTNSVGVSAALTTNVSSQPDGTLVAEVRDPAGEPVRAHAITVEIRRPDEDPLPVVMTYDEPHHRYVGHVTGVSAGSYPVQVTVQATPAAQPVEVVSAPITVVAVAALPLVLGGAIGNLVDRLRLGYVVDFILMHWKEKFYWPTYNVADIAITVGIALMIFEFIFGAKPKTAATPPSKKKSSDKKSDEVAAT